MIRSVLIAACLAAVLPAGAEQSGQTLRNLVERSYLELADLATRVSFPGSQYEQVRRELEGEKKKQAQHLESQEKQLLQKISQDRKELERLNRLASRDDEATTEKRRELHCRILDLERQAQEKRLERQHGMPVAFDNRLAKLSLLEHWPEEKRRVDAQIAAGQARQRRFGDVEDIGVRKVGEGQEKDVKKGEEAIKDLKVYGLMPPELADERVQSYVQGLANDLAAHSDIKVPVKVTILSSQEINAFALPGGFLYVNTGLIEKAESESELAGVLAHEMAHVAARHGARLMRKATIAGLVYQSAQIAAVIFTGGAVGIGTYYALQYGFFGLGLALNLTLLGVNREFEGEADQLGVQYCWRAGYDPRGFITFFDKMASEKGYVRSASFFRTHPPFFERILSTFKEMEFLPPVEKLKVDCCEFQDMKEHLKAAARKVEKERKESPKLRRFPECPEPPPSKDSQNIERSSGNDNERVGCP
ncbi:MAG: M48 family metalloprotease [Bryobacterales bacterium]|nr:M48 family metalloprotease [Bryobacterales bacterium]